LKSCGIGALDTPTIIFEDNAACVVQMESDYIKNNMTIHITPKLFYPHELQKNGGIEILQTKSCNNVADLFTKSLPYSTFHKGVEGIGMIKLRDLQNQGEYLLINNPLHIRYDLLYSFLCMSFTLKGFSYKVFNEAISAFIHVISSNFSPWAQFF
jgi:hypothetical protein